MRDGMLAKSYAVAMMDMRRTELCLGADAIRCQLEQSRKELEELQVVQRADKEALSQVIKYRDAIKEIDWDGGHYDFGAAYGLKDCKKRRDSLVKDREEIKANPDFTAVLKELETAGRLAREANESVNQNQSELGGCKNDLKGCEGTLSRISTEIYLCQKAYEEKCLVNMELKEAMLEEYNRESEKRGTIRVTTQLSIDKSKNMLAERERQLEEAGKLPSKQQPAIQEKPLPRRRPQARAAARPSPLVAGGVVVLLAMVVVLMLGYVTLTDVSGSVSSIKRQISDLDEQHVALLTEYEKTFDLATIKAAAEAAGMSKPTSGQIQYIDLSGSDSVTLYKAEGSAGGLLDKAKDGWAYVLEYFR